MGSTITTRRVAGGVRTHDSRTLFVLFEETYSSNTYPHTPEWCCVGFGYLPATMQRIFDLASSCEGGMLRSRSGHTPEGYIDTWLKELATPLAMRCTEVRLEAREGWPTTINRTELDAAIELLMKAGCCAQADELRSKGTVTLDLVRDADALLTLQEGLAMDPWRLVGAHAVAHRSGERDATLGYAAAPCRTPPALDAPAAMKLGADVRLLRAADGLWHCGGWQYALVGKYVRDLWRTELECPGCHRKRITTFRNALDGAPQAPAGLEVEIDAARTSDAYYLRKIEELQQQVNARSGTFRVPVTKENEYALSNLPRDCATWLLPHHRQPPPMKQAALIL